MRDTKHFREMLEERNIRPDWVQQALAAPDRVVNRDDGTQHYIKQIEQYGNRWLRVIVNPSKEPPTKVTVFFDRRLKGDENED